MESYLGIALLLLPAVNAVSQVTYNVQEKQEVGSTVGNVKADAGFSAQYDSSELAMLRFSILPGNGGRKDGSRFFSIVKNTGILRLASVIDRDILCFTKPECPMSFDVAVAPREFLQIITVHINVLDLNDHIPVFSETSAQLAIPESSPVGTTFSLPAAQDQDGVDFSIVAYTIEPQLSEFEIRAEPNTMEAMNLDLVIRESLDRESTQRYAFTVTAIDGGNPPQIGTMDVEIIVTDANDNIPVFDESMYVVEIPEDTMVQSRLINIHAADRDDGANAVITYGFTSSTSSFYGNTFEIDEDSGDIILLQQLDRETEAEYELTVTAKDGGSNGRMVTADVVIRVADVNDNQPDISLNTLTDDGLAQVSEAEDAGAFVALLTVDDPDLAQNGNVVCSLNSREFSLQLMRENKYTIVTREKLDRETEASYVIEVRCHDNGSPMLTSQETIVIKVLDANDNPPSFTVPSYRVQILENNFPGSFILQVNATDPDLGASGKVSYRLKNDFNSLFRINTETGKIVTRVSLNHEMSSSLELVVEAFDQGEPALASTATIFIDILDVNDEIPMFPQAAPTFIFEENSPIGSEVGFLEAMDPDSPPFNEIKYSVAALDNKGLIFDVDEDSGRITSRLVLDREQQSVYYLQASAGNPGAPAMTSTVTITIYVSDQNDNAPQIDFPTVSNSTIYMSNKVLRDDFITQIRAHDVDTGENAKLDYSIVQQDGSQQDKLKVDSSTGAVYLNTDLSRIEYEQYFFKAVVSDRGEPSHSSQMFFTVVVDATLPPPGTILDDSKEKGQQDEANRNTNLTVVIIVVAVSIVFIIVLVVAIVFVVCKSKHDKHRERPMKIEQFQGKPQIFYEVKNNETKGGTLSNRAAFALENTADLHQNIFRGEGSHQSNDYVEQQVTYKPDVIPQKHQRSKAKMSSFKEPDDCGSDENSSSGDVSNADSGRGGSEEAPRAEYNPYATTSPSQRMPPCSSDHNNTLPLPPRANRPVSRGDAGSPEVPSASIRPGMRTIKLRDKYERQREHDSPDRRCFSLLNQHLASTSMDRSPSKGHIDMSGSHIV
ncbi:hypothetical protein CAPTEDRAFT_227926 [Capitella teleta]|uniref:Cadherin domain-containing protein n=1 Tax=Capitella teleta TaxID=283909 RepID=R7TS06_CAPTE|nr:hypothetical protein CAPTEDRAFT_227926 [Capitella teleta]|eukprot:ELT94276.1 hypothetical protein CAPTEDRAFT_227926 [Capitella teleta]